MRAGFRQVVSVVAVFAIVLHTAFWAGLTPVATASAVDPFTVICHSGAVQPADQTPDQGAPAPGHACDHCNLCSAAAPPAQQTAIASQIEPVLVLQVLRPADVTRHSDITADPKLPRGPPVSA